MTGIKRKDNIDKAPFVENSTLDKGVGTIAQKHKSNIIVTPHKMGKINHLSKQYIYKEVLSHHIKSNI